MNRASRPVAREERRAGWRPSIATVLLFGFGGLVALAVATVLLISLRVAERNTVELLRSVARLNIELLERNLSSHLTPARNQAEFLADQLSRGTIPLDDTARLQDLLRGSLAAAPQISGVAYVRDDLYAVSASPDPGAGGVEAGSWIDRPDARLALRQGSVEDGFTWGEILYLQRLNNTYITLHAPVRRDDAFRGIVSAVVSISELSRYLSKSEQPSGGRSFVLYGRDRVLAHPALAGGPRGLSAENPLPALGEVGDAVLADIWDTPAESADYILSLPGRPIANRIVESGGEQYLFLYRELTGYGETPWIAGLHVRLKDVNAPMQRLNFALLAGGGIFVVAAVLALLLGRSLGVPLRRLETATEAIRRFEIGAAPRLSGSPFRELDATSKAYNAMLSGLKSFETYVPKPLVLRLMRQSAEIELASEERIVTVLFTDIVGFTTLGRQLPAPELAAFLNRHFALLGACIEREEGIIDKYIGDSVMAFWGAPADEPAHAARACRAALAIAEAVRDENARRRASGAAPVALRIGIHTGPAIVGNVGAPSRINYTLIGDTVNVAQRLEQLGKEIDGSGPDGGPNEVMAIISAATAASLPPDIPVVPLGPRQLRGGETIEVFRLI
ncbi:adenylate/guanylate cyclase domain-containing protein [Rhodospirillaceae bacterium SYSU D60014]|uniref:adenylate/guanylate cyclase domain-containing protein n=1 Tax=Virgifigura deserti TaxID=2268457 RepID=UPI000E664D5A